MYYSSDGKVGMYSSFRFSPIHLTRPPWFGARGGITLQTTETLFDIFERVD